MQVLGTAVTSPAEPSARPASTAARLPGNCSLASAFGVVEMTIFGYASTTWKKAVTVAALRPGGQHEREHERDLGGGLWNSTAAITRVQILGSHREHADRLQLRIYGRL